MPLASQCQMSTQAPVSGEQLLPLRFCTLITSVRGTPARATPVAGSVRMSERNSFSSTQYGPSVTVGVEGTQVSAASMVSFQAGINNAAAPALANKDSVVRRLVSELPAVIFSFAVFSILDTGILL